MAFQLRIFAFAGVPFQKKSSRAVFAFAGVPFQKKSSYAVIFAFAGVPFQKKSSRAVVGVYSGTHSPTTFAEAPCEKNYELPKNKKIPIIKR
jgi:hypothetical protein